MLFDLGMWLFGLTLFAPALLLGLAWVRAGRFYSNNPTQHWRRVLYQLALVAGCASTLASIAYWGWRVCGMYQIALPFAVLLTLERSIRVCQLLSAVAIVCLLVGKGPYRVPLAISILWLMVQLWTHGHIIHWA